MTKRSAPIAETAAAMPPTSFAKAAEDAGADGILLLPPYLVLAALLDCRTHGGGLRCDGTWSRLLQPR